MRHAERCGQAKQYNADPPPCPHSDILIHAASIAYNQAPDFSLHTPNQIAQTGLIRMAFTGPLAVKKRRVRPRMYGLLQPRDDDHGQGEDTSESSNKAKARL